MNVLSYFVDRFPLEWKILEAFDKIANDFLNMLFFILSKFGSGEIVFAMILFIYYLVDKKLGKKLAYILGSSFIINGILKSLFLAKRPFQFEEHKHLKKLSDSMDNSTGTSFPSGHSQNAGTIYTAIYYNNKKKWIKGLCIAALIIVPITRLYLGVHFPGDVIVGLLVGMLVTLVLNRVYDNINHTKKYYIISLVFILLSLPTMIINFNNLAVADLYKSFGLYLAIILGFFIEEKYINFSHKVPVGFLALRLLIGAGIVLGLKSGLKAIFPNHNFFHMLRYFIMSFAGIALVPLLFKKEGKNEQRFGL